MAEVITMPRLSDTMTEGKVSKWHKKVGDTVKEGDVLAEIETDKAVQDFESEFNGTLLYIGVEEGGNAPVDSVLAIIGNAGEDVSSLIGGGAATPVAEAAPAVQETVAPAPSAAAEIPAGVEVTVAEGNVVTVKGPKGTLERALPTEMEIKVEDGHVVVSRPNDLKKMKSLHGLTRSLIHNMVVGVSEGYTKELEVNGVGYKAAKQGKKLTLSLGYSHPVEMEDPDGIETKVDGNKIIVSGISKEKVGQFAAEIRDKRRPEPYKGKGIKYVDEVIRRKVGKTGKK